MSHLDKRQAISKKSEAYRSSRSNLNQLRIRLMALAYTFRTPSVLRPSSAEICPQLCANERAKILFTITEIPLGPPPATLAAPLRMLGGDFKGVKQTPYPQKAQGLARATVGGFATADPANPPADWYTYSPNN